MNYLSFYVLYHPLYSIELIVKRSQDLKYNLN